MTPFNKLLFASFSLSLGLLTACQTSPHSVNTEQFDPIKINQQLEQTSIIKSPNNNRSYAVMMLPNGLQVVLVSDASLQNAAASLAVGVGTAQDPKEQLGLAHYLEHMLFLGTQKYPEPNGFMNFTTANGGMSNAFTGLERTNYLFQINAEKFDEALDRFSDYFKQPTFDPAYSEKERNAVNSEWSLKKAQDDRNLMGLQSLTLNPLNPAARFGTGNLSTLADKPGSVLQEELIKFYTHYYSANIMKLTLMSNQSLPELKQLAQKHFASIPNHQIPLPQIQVPGITPKEMGKIIQYKPQRDMKSLFIDFPLVTDKQDWRYKADEYVSQLLASEEPGTLAEQLRQRGLAKSVSASMQSNIFGPDGYLRVAIELTETGLKQQDQAIAAVFAYVDLIKNSPIDERYYAQSKAIAENYFATAPTAPPLQQTIALSMGQFEYPPENLLNNYAVFERFNSDKIKAILDQLERKNVRIWYVDKKQQVDKNIPFYDGQYALRDLTQADLARWDIPVYTKQFNLPPLNDLFSAQATSIVPAVYKKPHMLVSSPGVEAFLTHSQFFTEDKGVITLQLNADADHKGIDEHILAYLLDYVYKKQTMTLTDRASMVALQVHQWVDATNSQVISVAGSTGKHDYLIGQMLNEFVHLRIDEPMFKQAVDSYLQSIDAKHKGQMYFQAMGHFDRLTRPGRVLDEAYVKRVKTLNGNELIRYQQGCVQNSLLRLFAVGNYTEQHIQDLAQHLHDILPSSRAPNTRAIPVRKLPATGQLVNYLARESLADDALVEVWFGAEKSIDENAQLNVLAAVFDGAFNTQLRTQQQLGYVVQSDAMSVAYVPAFMLLVQSPNTALVDLKMHMDKFRRNYLATLEQLDERTILAARDTQLANLNQKPSDFYQESTWFSEEFMTGEYQFDLRERYLAALQKVTKADVIAVYKKLLLNEKSGRILVQMRGTNFKDKPVISN